MTAKLRKIESDGYPIYLGSHAFVEMHEFLVTYYKDAKKFMLVDENTLQFCLPEIDMHVDHLKNAEIIEIQSGEENKNINIVIGVWESLIELGADRQSLIINLGGGVIGDMGGFIASTFKRGIEFINIPTTLLAQVDASVGGKVGIDFQNLKNQIGVFNNPKAVFICPRFLKTLDEEQVVAGFAEIVKHALIRDRDYWAELQGVDLSRPATLTDIVHRSVEIKNSIVMADPRESGLRKALNFGHTIGHAIESYSFEESNEPLLHGEAVAIGMICEAFISHEVLGLSQEEMLEITTFINNRFPVYQIDELAYHRLFELMKSDKKNQQGRINFTLLKTIGEAKIDQTCKFDTIIKAFDFYKNSSTLTPSN